MRIVLVRVGAPPVIKNVTHSLERMQSLVGGYLDRFALDAQTDCWCNDEGLLVGLPPNRLVTNQRGEEWPVMGDFYVAGHDGRGNTVSLTRANAEAWVVRISRMPMGRPRR